MICRANVFVARPFTLVSKIARVSMVLRYMCLLGQMNQTSVNFEFEHQMNGMSFCDFP